MAERMRLLRKLLLIAGLAGAAGLTLQCSSAPFIVGVASRITLAEVFSARG
jgi:hypothetical protein